MAACNPDETMDGAMHWFNHVLFPPDDRRFIFLHRWTRKQNLNVYWFTRLYTANVDGSNIRCVNPQNWCRDGRSITFDSSHEGVRQVYKMDLSDILDGKRRGPDLQEQRPFRPDAQYRE